MAVRRNVAVDWRVSDLRAVGSMFSGQFEWVISCMALDNILENSGLAEAVGAMREALTPSGGCYIRVRNFEQLLAVRPRYDVREERLVPHGRVIRLEDWLYESEQHVVNVWIFLREDTRRTGYVWDTTIFAYRRRALTSSELTTTLRDAGFDAIHALPQGNAWDPIQLVARRP
jgi:rhodanese-related sulfurtransferase